MEKLRLRPRIGCRARAVPVRVVPALCLVLASACFLRAQGLPIDIEDVASKVRRLGVPGESLYPGGEWAYARNVWDMQSFDGRLYLGMGNSNNHPPAPNAKGGHIWSYDPHRDRFIIEFKADEEQVDRFRVIDGRLTVPGHDPTDSWKYGNWYRLEADGWRKHRNLPRGIHCYDMIGFDGEMFAALGSKPGSEVVVRSEDGGRTWKPCGIRGMRAYTLFTVGDKLFVSLYGGVAVWDGKRFHENPDIPWFPGHEGDEEIRLVTRAVRLGKTAVYVGACRAADHQWTPFGLYAARGIRHIEKIDLPGKPWDLLVEAGTLYVLSALEAESSRNGTVVRVTATENGIDWRPLFQFRSPTFARSFEHLEGAFYFGLGCEADDLKPETGTVLRLRWPPD